MLSESLRVPYRADDAFGTILVGSALTVSTLVLVAVWTVLLVASPWVGVAVTPLVALPTLVMRGYLLGVVGSGIQDEPTVPSFVRWGSLVRTGGSSALLSAIYLLPAAVLAGLAVGGWIAAAVDPAGFTETAQALVGVLILVSGFGLLIYGLVYLYVRPAARAVFAATGSLRAALRVRRVLRLATTSDYLTGWLIAMGLLTVGPSLLLPLVGIAVAVGYFSPVAALIILLVTFLGGICLTFVIRVSAAWATGCGAATGLGGLSPGAISDPPDEMGVLVNVEAEPAPEPTPETEAVRPEADPTVQTGRTVRPTSADRQPGEQPDVSVSDGQPTPTVAAEPDPTPAEENDDGSALTDDSEEADDHADEPQTDTVEPEAEGDDSEIQGAERHSADGDGAEESPDTESDDDTGFVWGVNDEQ